MYCVHNYFNILYPIWKTVWIQIDWFHMKPADQDSHYFSSIPYIHVTNEIATYFGNRLLTFFSQLTFSKILSETQSVQTVLQRLSADNKSPC